MRASKSIGTILLVITLFVAFLFTSALEWRILEGIVAFLVVIRVNRVASGETSAGRTGKKSRLADNDAVAGQIPCDHGGEPGPFCTCCGADIRDDTYGLFGLLAKDQIKDCTHHDEEGEYCSKCGTNNQEQLTHLSDEHARAHPLYWVVHAVYRNPRDQTRRFLYDPTKHELFTLHELHLALFTDAGEIEECWETNYSEDELEIMRHRVYAFNMGDKRFPEVPRVSLERWIEIALEFCAHVGDAQAKSAFARNIEAAQQYYPEIAIIDFLCVGVVSVSTKDLWYKRTLIEEEEVALAWLQSIPHPETVKVSELDKKIGTMRKR